MGNVIRNAIGWVREKSVWLISILAVIGLIAGELETKLGRQFLREVQVEWNRPDQNVGSAVIAEVLQVSVNMRCSHTKAPEGNGSGVFLHRFGHTYVLTAHHVVECELTNTANFGMSAYQGTNVWKLKLVSTDKKHDLALLRVDAPGLVGKSIRWFSPFYPPPMTGSRLLHVGNLLGDCPHSYSEGVVARLDVTEEDEPTYVFDQSTVNAWRGSSGGGIFTSDGRYVGMLLRGRGPQFNLYGPVRRIYQWADENNLNWIF